MTAKMVSMGETWSSFCFRSSQLLDRVIDETIPDLLISPVITCVNMIITIIIM